MLPMLHLANIHRKLKSEKTITSYYVFLPKNEDDPRVDAHILVQGFGRRQGQITSPKNNDISKR